MKSLLFVLALIVAFVCAIPTPARACNAVAFAPAAQTVCQSAVVQQQAVYAPAFLLAAPLVVQSQIAVQAVESCPSVGFSAQSYGAQSFSAQSYGFGAENFNVGRRSRIRSRFRGRGALGLGLGLNALGLGLGADVAIDPVTGLPVEVIDPLFGSGGRFRGNALGRRGRGRGSRTARIRGRRR